MKAAIVYFSGTGNTFRVGEVFKAYLETIDYEVEMIDITKHSSDLKGYDLFVVGTPTQNSTSTFNMHDFIGKHISKKNNPNARFITYVTHSWGTAFGHLTLKDFARKKGFKVVGARAFIAPNNWYMYRKDEPKFSDNEVKQALQNIHKGVWSLMDSYVKGSVQIDERPTLKKNLAYTKAKLMSSSTMVSRLAKFMMKVDADKCTKCKVCVKQCPGENISLRDGKIEFSNQCLACGRCIHVCPKNAYMVSGEKFEQYEGIKKPIMEQLEL
ncbi:EFR1 family ferrodoxin [Anaeromicrobium sediminis]|uniref:Ferredoxin n=1 Tax=Anaeromicrobium sediminis TaxID=1478221 RepID=A0A267MNE9_9FIRM|nr:EFR1 family ferrodoxin [Anaeromicrobium sediminis]PAB60405.1 hypothetical protein CCE28_05790 [Anaeromicrobium sediminis]